MSKGRRKGFATTALLIKWGGKRGGDTLFSSAERKRGKGRSFGLKKNSLLICTEEGKKRRKTLFVLSKGKKKKRKGNQLKREGKGKIHCRREARGGEGGKGGPLY